jgi:uncharacterized integral membrane protein
MKQIKWIIVILLVLLVIIVAVQNHGALSTSVKFRVNLIFFNFETAEMSLYLVSIITFLVGVICAGLYGMSERFRLKKQIKTLMRNTKEKEKELNSLRNLPVTTEDMSSNQSA